MAPAAVHVLEAVRTEVSAIWPRQSVAIEWVAGAPVIVSDSPLLHVVLQDDPTRLPSPGGVPALATIGFTNGQPGHTIVASTGSAAQLLARWLRRHGSWQISPMDLIRPGALERLTARLTGWAVAHEIGHYVLAAARHDAVGLMRATFDPYDVITSNPQAATLAPQSARQLSARIHKCADGAARRVAP
jgi:hypothetical protein